MEVGPVDLDVVLRGASDAGARLLLDQRLAPFVHTVGAGRRIACDWTVTGSGWQPVADPEGRRSPRALRLSPTAWYAEWCYYRMSFARDRSDGMLSDRPSALEHALRGAAIFASMPGEALFFHAATLVYEGEAILVAGSPNAGKSTISREGAPDALLSNEISIIERRAERWWALPSPFWGTGDRAQRAEPAPLRAIAVLGRAERQNLWQPLHGARALAELLPHAGCQAAAQLAEPDLLGVMADLISDVPVYSFRWFRPAHPLDGSPWNR